MINKDKYLYIFLHIPKCGGTTFYHHILQNFKKEEILVLHENFFSMEESIYEAAKHKDGYEWLKQKRKVYKKKFEDYIYNLPNTEKDKIKIIYGHYIYYGIHKYFNKIPRYITFVRNPIYRTVSLYNFLVNSFYEMPLDQNNINPFLVNNKLISFDRFIDNIYGEHYIFSLAMISCLKGLNYFTYLKANNTNNIDASFISAINKFYFIGITENNNEDFLFLYNMLGIRKYYPNQNFSKKYFSLKKDEYIKHKIFQKNKYDQKFYHMAVEFNKSFRKREKYFYIIVYITRIKYIFYIEISSILQMLYNLSDKFKRYSSIYKKMTLIIKNNK